MKPTFVVNLSGVVEYDINKAFAEFIKIYTDYSPSCSPCSSSGFFSVLDSAKIKILFYKNEKLINQYKLGKMTTDEFLNKMLKVFSFLENVTLNEEYFLKIIEHKYKLMVPLSESDKDDLSYTPAGKKALLELAWTSGIQEINEKLWDSIKNNAEKICFISNTNTMDLNKSLQILLGKLSVCDLKEEIKKEETDVKIEIISEIVYGTDQDPLLNKSKIDANKMLGALQKKFPKFDLHLSKKGCISIRNSSPEIEIYTSNLCGAFKTLEENKNKNKNKKEKENATPSLVGAVIESLIEEGTSTDEIVLLSQYQKDFDPAKERKLPKENIMTIQDYAKKELKAKAGIKY